MDKRPGRINFILLFLIILLQSSCSKPEKDITANKEAMVPITIAVAGSPLSTPLYIARDKEYFAEEGLAVRFLEMTSGRKCLEAVFAGNADLATVADVPVVLNSFVRDDYVVVATLVYMYNSLKIAARMDSYIRTPSDLAGKRVGIVPGTTSQFFMDLFIRRNGLDPGGVEMVGMEPGEMEPALESKQVEAVSIWEPYFFSIMNKFDHKLVVLGQDAVYRRTFNLVTRRDFAGKDRQKLAGVLRALDRAKTYARENEQDARKLIAAEMGEDDEFVSWVWNDFETSLDLDQELLIILEELARSAIMHGYVQQTEIPNYLQFLDTGPLYEALPENVTIISR